MCVYVSYIGVFRPLAGVLTPILGLYTPICVLYCGLHLLISVCVCVFICVCVWVCVYVLVYVSYISVSMPPAGVLTPILGLYTPLCVFELLVSVSVPILGLNTLISMSRTVTYYC